MPVTLERVGQGVPHPESVPYQPFGANRELMRDRARELLIEGPADTGKSMACLNKLLLSNLNYPKNRTAMVRKTRRSLTQSTMVSFEQKVLPPGLRGIFHESDQEYRFPNGSVCIVGGLDDPGKVFSTEFDFIYVNEADQLEEKDWQSLRARVTGRWGAMPYAQLLGDLNPTLPDHWLYQREASGVLRVLTARHEDNPTITPERLAALESLTGWLRKRLYLGIRAAPEGMFFTEWEPEKHLCDPFPIPAHWTRWTMTDYGFADPFAHYAMARAPDKERTIYVFREIYAKGLRAEDQAELVTKRIRSERDDLGIVDPKVNLYARHVGDPSMFNKRNEANLPSIADVYRAKGVHLEPAGNNRKQGWSVVRDALAWGDDKPPRLRVFRGRCPNLERTLPAMVHDPLDPEDLADKVNNTKTEDHAVDSIRYGLMAEAQAASPGVLQAVIGG